LHYQTKERFITIENCMSCHTMNKTQVCPKEKWYKKGLQTQSFT